MSCGSRLLKLFTPNVIKSRPALLLQPVYRIRLKKPIIAAWAK